MYALSRLLLLLTVLVCVYMVAILVLAAGLIFGSIAWILLGVLVIALAARKGRRWFTSGGTASWATLRALQNVGMTEARTGLCLGRVIDDAPGLLTHNVKNLLDPRVAAAPACRQFLDGINKRKRKQGQMIHLPQAVHTTVFAPTRVGKGASLIFPWLLTQDANCVVLDPKGELALGVSARRRQLGHRVVVLDPYRLVTKTPDTLNSLDFIDADDPLALDDCRVLAEAMVVREKDNKDPHWPDSAETVIRSIMAAVVMYGSKAKGTRSLQDIRHILSQPQQWDTIKQVLRNHGGMLARWGGDLDAYRGDELGSVRTTVNRFLNFLDTIPIAESTMSSTFDPADLRRPGKKMTVFLVLPVDKMRVQAPLMRLWLSTIFQGVLRGGLGESRKVHFILDEAAALGEMRQLRDAVDKYAGFGVRCQFYYQSISQLKECWPNDLGQTLLSNTTKIFFGTDHIETADFISKSLGNETIIVDNGGSNWGTSRQTGTTTGSSYSQSSSNTGSSGGSSGWQQQTRELLKSDEVLTLSPRTAIILGAPGVRRPIMTTLVRYFEEPALFRHRGFFSYLQGASLTFLHSAGLLLFATLVAAGLTAWLADVTVKARHARQQAASQPRQAPPGQAPWLLPNQPVQTPDNNPNPLMPAPGRQPNGPIHLPPMNPHPLPAPGTNGRPTRHP